MNVMKQYGIRGTTATAIARSIEDAVRNGQLTAGTGMPTVRAVATGTRVTARPPVAPLAALPRVTVPAHLRNLADGNPDPALLPLLRPAFARLTGPARLYGDRQNDADLLKLAARAFTADGIDPAALAVTGGALDAVERILQAHLRPGDRVLVEDPAYSAILDLLGALGLVIEPVAIDDAGFVPAALQRALRRTVHAVILTPRAQNPTGACLDASRVSELGRLLAQHPDLLMIEDDHAGPIAGVRAHTLTADRARWAVVRSVSKWLGPDLRIALVAGDPTTIARVEGRQQVGAGWASHILQRVVVELWGDPEITRRLKTAAAAYTARRELLMQALAQHGIASHGASGLNVWIPVPEEAAVMAALAGAGFAVRAGERYRIKSPAAVRVTVAALKPGEAERVAIAIARCLGPTPHTASA
jgi:DNA-binding transcriptional MocR family regulator